MKNQKGTSILLVIIIIAVLFVGAAAVAYYSSAPKVQVEIETPAAVSDLDETKTIETEIRSTEEGSLESDFKELDSEASSI